MKYRAIHGGLSSALPHALIIASITLVSSPRITKIDNQANIPTKLALVREFGALADPTLPTVPLLAHVLWRDRAHVLQ